MFAVFMVMVSPGFIVYVGLSSVTHPFILGYSAITSVDCDSFLTVAFMYISFEFSVK